MNWPMLKSPRGSSRRSWNPKPSRSRGPIRSLGLGCSSGGASAVLEPSTAAPTLSVLETAALHNVLATAFSEDPETIALVKEASAAIEAAIKASAVAYELAKKASSKVNVINAAKFKTKLSAEAFQATCSVVGAALTSPSTRIAGVVPAMGSPSAGYAPYPVEPRAALSDTTSIRTADGDRIKMSVEKSTNRHRHQYDSHEQRERSRSQPLAHRCKRRPSLEHRVHEASLLLERRRLRESKERAAEEAEHEYELTSSDESFEAEHDSELRSPPLRVTRAALRVPGGTPG